MSTNYRGRLGSHFQANIPAQEASCPPSEGEYLCLSDAKCVASVAFILERRIHPPQNCTRPTHSHEKHDHTCDELSMAVSSACHSAELAHLVARSSIRLAGLHVAACGASDKQPSSVRSAIESIFKTESSGAMETVLNELQTMARDHLRRARRAGKQPAARPIPVYVETTLTTHHIFSVRLSAQLLAQSFTALTNNQQFSIVEFCGSSGSPPPSVSSNADAASSREKIQSNMSTVRETVRACAKRLYKPGIVFAGTQHNPQALSCTSAVRIVRHADLTPRKKFHCTSYSAAFKLLSILLVYACIVVAI